MSTMCWAWVCWTFTERTQREHLDAQKSEIRETSHERLTSRQK